MRLFFEPCGPMMRYQDGLLKVSDLNPEINTQWRMSRWEMLRLGWRCIVAGLQALLSSERNMPMRLILIPVAALLCFAAFGMHSAACGMHTAAVENLWRKYPETRSEYTWSYGYCRAMSAPLRGALRQS